AYTKTEPVQVAVFGLLFLGDRITLSLAIAIATATAGVMLMSWPKQVAFARGGATSWRPSLLGMVAGGCFALAVIGFRGGILALTGASFVMAATTTLVIGLAMQTALLGAYFLLADRA